ncbi:MAG: 30S ribosomal protein S17 [Endomicrobium sp.]|jgi:small subunit ribosomal protein S17|nr:30S ribosomal protein S17 [Endomicrobium sp.]
MLERKKRRYRVGTVIRDKNTKTKYVLIERSYRHLLYGRVIRVKSKIVVHDEKNVSHVGDVVKVIECRPFSKTKRWALVKVL